MFRQIALLTVTAGLLISGCDKPTRSQDGDSGAPDACGDLASIPAGSIGYSETSHPGAFAGTYEKHAPILVENLHAPADDPYVIEGYEISSASSNCIEVRNSENVIIRNNHLHDCTWSKDPAEPFSQEEGFAILVGNSSEVTVETNLLEKNKMGIAAHTTRDLKVQKNTITTTLFKNSLRLERVQQAEIADNHLSDNGIPEWFWAPGHRIIGIHIVRSADIDVHDNTVIRSSSDGISGSGQIDGGGLTTPESDWTGTADDIRIHNNLLLDNMELGIWLVRARNLEIFSNTIRSGCFTHGSGIALDFDVGNSEVYANQIVTCLNPGHIGLSGAHDNHIHDNIHYSIDGAHPPIKAHDDLVNDQIKANWSGIPLKASSGNRVENDFHRQLEGELKRAIEAKLEIAESERTWEEKGWFSCEIVEGLLDDQCVAEQAALGNQGIPHEYLIFDPLMADPDPYAVDEGCP